MTVEADSAGRRKSAGSGHERRQHQRLPAERLKGVSVELSAGSEIILKDLSRSGARFQGPSRLLPGLWVALRLVTPDGALTMRAKVVRSRLVRMEKGGMVYEAAVSFAELLPQTSFPGVAVPAEEAVAESQPAAASQAAPVPTPAAAPAPAPAPIEAPATVAPPATVAAAAPDEPSSADAPSRTEDTEDDDLPLVLLTASVTTHTVTELHDMFNGNEW